MGKRSTYDGHFQNTGNKLREPIADQLPAESGEPFQYFPGTLRTAVRVDD